MCDLDHAAADDDDSYSMMQALYLTISYFSSSFLQLNLFYSFLLLLKLNLLHFGDAFQKIALFFLLPPLPSSMFLRFVLQMYVCMMVVQKRKLTLLNLHSHRIMIISKLGLTSFLPVLS